jgi:hypothetical protein
MIWITTDFIGYHCYPNAPVVVSYLQSIHRHKFGVKVWIEIFTNERDLEFHMFKHFVDTCLTQSNQNSLSCESISDNLATQISSQYPNREVFISIDEDGECGSYKEYQPTI